MELRGSRSAAMPAVAERRRIMRQASGWLMGWTDTVLPLWPTPAWTMPAFSARTRGAERDRRRLMPLRVRIAGLLIAAGGFGPAAADQPDTANAVIPGGAGVLTKCRGWLVTSSCRTYHHISLPSRIAVGDTITISFGSHPKEYRFSVARIALKDDLCTIVSDADEDRQKIDKINVAPCYRADEGR
jgi:hypothetical protein